ncbi:MAG: hypothetical protein HY598_02445 [Candidatus Omnitrophica bacterium]|nr:hypothetical protein [Candidatus Omnitrophota bacterium]
MRKQRSALLLVAGVLALAAAVLALRQQPLSQSALRYKHSLEYPAYQQQELLQVGSLDRG